MLILNTCNLINSPKIIEGIQLKIQNLKLKAI